MLPYKPESLESALARFPLALALVYSVEDVQSGKSKRPGEHQPHVFDFQDGVRMIASRETSEGEPVFLHLSFSIRPGSGYACSCAKEKFEARLTELIKIFSAGWSIKESLRTGRAYHFKFSQPPGESFAA